MPDLAPPPTLIATIGLHASASTWVFNVVRELLIAAVGEASVTCLHAERLDQILDAAAPTGRHLVIKSHAGSLDLDAWLAQHRVCRFISLRDPRDAAISMAQRFTAPLAHTARWLAEDCNRLLRLARATTHCYATRTAFSKIRPPSSTWPTGSACAPPPIRSPRSSPATAPMPYKALLPR